MERTITMTMMESNYHVPGTGSPTEHPLQGWEVAPDPVSMVQMRKLWLRVKSFTKGSSYRAFIHGFFQVQRIHVEQTYTHMSESGNSMSSAAQLVACV